MAKPDVSIIMPVFNMSDLLLEAVRSILNQEPLPGTPMPSLEVLVVKDSCSHPQTRHTAPGSPSWTPTTAGWQPRLRHTGVQFLTTWPPPGSGVHPLGSITWAASPSAETVTPACGRRPQAHPADLQLATFMARCANEG